MSTKYLQLHKSRFVSPIQKKIMLRYLWRNPELMSAKFSVKFNFKDAQMKWSELAGMLNRMPGSRKHWKQWRKTWHDLRSKAKAKLQQGGPIHSESDKDILKLIGELNSDNVYTDNDVVKAEEDEDEFEDASAVSLDKFLSTMKNNPLSFGANQKNLIIEVLPEDCTDDRVCEDDTSFESRNRTSPTHPFDKLETKRDHSMSQQNYQEQKLRLLKRIAVAKENSAAAKERIATALEKIAESQNSVL